jgi:hypothetical protein
MSTNKTRLAICDILGGSAYQISTQIEFDVYQEAIDYIETFLTNKPSNVQGVHFWLFNYDRPSYLYKIDGSGDITKEEITFPDLLP